jgi:hypothetical protein
MGENKNHHDKEFRMIPIIDRVIGQTGLLKELG